MAWGPRPVTPPRTGEHGFSLGGIEIGTVLGCLNILFLAFIVVQFRYFFGGTAQVQVAPGLSYAVYARRGFFELVTVGIVAAVYPDALHVIVSLAGRRPDVRCFSIRGGAMAEEQIRRR